MSATQRANLKLADEDGAPAEEASSKSGLLPLVLAIFLGLGAGAGAGGFVVGPMLAGGGGGGGEGHEAAADGHGKGGAAAGAAIHSVDNLVVNPAGTKGARFLILTLALEVDAQTTVDELERRDAQLRDALTQVLAAKSVEDLSDIGQREGLKQELLTTAGALLPRGRIVRLYLPQFVIQ